jgi:hypothetical protein
LGLLLFELERNSRLAFPIVFRDQTLETVGQAIDLFSKLSPEQATRHYWNRAILMMQIAIKSRPYLTAATINLETAATIATATTARATDANEASQKRPAIRDGHRV